MERLHRNVCSERQNFNFNCHFQSLKVTFLDFSIYNLSSKFCHKFLTYISRDIKKSVILSSIETYCLNFDVIDGFLELEFL